LRMRRGLKPHDFHRASCARSRASRVSARYQHLYRPSVRSYRYSLDS
jgi:hypothetical protein